MKISKQIANLLFLTICVCFIMRIGKICGFSEEILKEVIKCLITVFFSFEVIIKLHFSIIKKGKKVIMNIDFFTKAN